MDSLDLPLGSGVCHLSIIDTTTDGILYAQSFLEPAISGHEMLNLKTFCYLIVNEKSKEHVLFDLGMRRDWWNATPSIRFAVETYFPALRIDKDVAQIVEEANIPLEKIKAVVLSHSHVDHVGNMSLFPHSTDVVVGPGFQSLYEPFYPDGNQSPFHAYEFEGRKLVELDFSSSTEIGSFQAHDYFGDGSFYLLHTPGHTTEHLAGLVRTTVNPDTFVLLGGDCCHFMGVMRPNGKQPMPTAFGEDVDLSPIFSTPHSSSFALSCHPDGPENGRSKPFYCPSSSEGSAHVDPAQGKETVGKLALFDADPRVLVTIAHDPTLGEVLPLFPNATINNWKEKRYKEKLMWNWVKFLPRDGKPGVPLHVDGLYKEGQKIRGLLMN